MSGPVSIRHLMPYDGIGGVEVAARSADGLSGAGFSFALDYIWADVAGFNARARTFSPLGLLAKAAALARNPPDVLIVSLWRAALVGVLVKLVRPRLRLVLFLHNIRDEHAPDRWATRAAAALACQWWADAAQTLDQRIPGFPGKTRRVISFRARDLAALPAHPPAPHFIYWGRLGEQKRVDNALRLFAGVAQARSDARFTIIGPDGGCRAALEAQVQALGLAQAVHFAGPQPMEAIVAMAQNASFYLQTSAFEGMAMAVVEAMQLGLVPVVTPVGEIAHYCRDGANAVLVADDAGAVARIMALLDDADAYGALRKAAIAQWQGQPSYRQSLAAACSALVAGNGSAPPFLTETEPC